MRSYKWTVSWVVVAAFTGFLAGCFETETPLGLVEQAVIDARLVGDWTTHGGEGGGETVELTVRNFNGREFYVEQRQAGQDTARYAAYVIELKSVPFVNVRELKDDGTVPKKHTVMRIDRVDDRTINLRHLNGDFFADKPHETTAQLRELIEKHFDDAAMYAGDPMVLKKSAAE